MNRLQEIEQRLSEIVAELKKPESLDESKLNALETEATNLKQERTQIKANADKRANLLKDVMKNGDVIEDFKNKRKANFDEMTKEEIVASPEYRKAWLKNLQGKSLTEIEQRALTASAAMPEQTANKIVDLMVDMVPLLNEIELFRIPGNINVAVETVAPAGTLEATGASATVATATLRQVALGGYNINAFIQVGADLAAMAIPAFEDWLVRKLADAIAYKIEYYIISGDGNSAPKGIASYVATWDDSDGNAVDWDGSALDAGDIDQAIGNLPAAYDKNAKFLMSKKTFFTNVIGITDTNNYPIISKEGKDYYIRGYKVIFSDQVTAAVIYFGDFKRGMVGNLSSDIKVEKQRNLQYNCWDFLGWGVFDCEPAAAGCIIKIASDIQA